MGGSQVEGSLQAGKCPPGNAPEDPCLIDSVCAWQDKTDRHADRRACYCLNEAGRRSQMMASQEGMATPATAAVLLLLTSGRVWCKGLFST